MAFPSFNNYYLTLALLAACTVVGIGVAVRFRREVDEDLAPPTAKDLLDPLEKAYYSGLMRPDEIERIRESVKKSRGAASTSKSPSRPAAQRSNADQDRVWPGAGTDLGAGDTPPAPGAGGAPGDPGSSPGD